MTHVAFDFVNSAGTAQWMSQGPQIDPAVLPFPGAKDQFRQGFALVWPAPFVEDGNRPPVALGIHPRTAQGAELIGRYPPFVLQQGDVFESIIGFLQDSNPKAVCRWELGYYDVGAHVSVGMVDKAANGQLALMRYDLSPHASGRPVELTLRVVRLNNEKDFEPVLITPRIDRTWGEPVPY